MGPGLCDSGDDGEYNGISFVEVSRIYATQETPSLQQFNWTVRPA